ncbi:MAG: ISKra4 family transposase, partial [Oscillatoriales cyanobacterium RM2_1_1]|nr:ISKra4 family transposase [Oscillatoriales cyanobacterium RM2_1_1]
STPRYQRSAQNIIGEDKPPPARPTLKNKRVWASVRQDAESVIHSVFEEATRRDPQHQREWVGLVDGNTHQLKVFNKTAKQTGVELTLILDFIHVLEYLWKAAFCFHLLGSKEAETWVRERALRLLEGKASDVAVGIRRSATLNSLSDKEREPVDQCANYLLNHRDYLHYDQYLAQGYPIATGVIEGACRHLVCDRMDITGARWRLDRAEAVLRIRALSSSGDFQEYWHFHKLQEFQRNHLRYYQDPQKILAV